MIQKKFLPTIWYIFTPELRQYEWQIATLDGEHPCETISFFHKNDLPSYHETGLINEIMSSEMNTIIRKKISVDDLILNYDIETEIFEDWEDWADIKKAIFNALKGK